MQNHSGAPWFPLFEFIDLTYWAFSVCPEGEELMGPPPGPVTAKFVSMGPITFGQAMKEADDRYRVDGWIETSGQGRIEVSATGRLRPDAAPATFEATCVQVNGPAKTVLFELSGWVFPEEPVRNDAARVLGVRGAVRMLGDPASSAATGGIVRGDVGLFVMTRR
jgi:hypothetical protein